ncbi:MAG: cyclic nucleotide-binding domain-containing protein [Mycobacterium sp.]|nr:cyclic nucleotide-binding domain-containing protein [Mycobacterium sp.]
MAANEKTQRKWAELQQADDVSRLRGFPAFSNFSDDDLRRLVSAAHHDSMSAPWPLIHEQTPADACYILLSGDVNVYVGRDQIATLGPGEVIGESAIRGQLRSATVTTTGPAEVLRFEAENLSGLLREVPAFRELIEANALRHVPVAPASSSQSEPQLAKVNVSVSAELLKRFEQAAAGAGLPVASALEDALTRWVDSR